MSNYVLFTSLKSYCIHNFVQILAAVSNFPGPDIIVFKIKISVLRRYNIFVNYNCYHEQHQPITGLEK